MKNTLPENDKLNINQILNWLEADGILSPSHIERCRQFGTGDSAKRKHPLKVIALAEVQDQTNLGKLLTLEALTVWLANRVGMPYHYIDPLKIDIPKVTSLYNKKYAENYKILPILYNDKEIIIATSEPFIRHWEADLIRMHNCTIKRVISNPDEIDRYLGEFYSFATSLSSAKKARADDKPTANVQNFEQLLELTKSTDLDANNQHVVNLVNWLLQYAFDQRASDIHIEPRRTSGNVRFRIDGILHHVYTLPMQIMNAVLSRLKILGRMNIAEKRLPQDGRIKTQNNQKKEIELRLSTLPTAFGEKLVMRIFDPEVLMRNYEQLGFNNRELGLWESMTTRTHGIILVTGPTGSGKTTTLYSTLKNLATPEVNLCTVEDPIEQIEPAFNQMQVQHNIGLGFASGIRALMRQDPDIIMVGEIRDLETAEMAVQASLTGHLVLSTLHTNNAPAAITRLINLGLPGYLIQQTIIGVMAQRLIRTLCKHCKTPKPISDSEWQSLVTPFKAAKPEQIYQAVGCLECRNTGYSGRIGIYEIFENTPALQKMIVDGCDLDVLKKQACIEGMRPLRLSGAEKVAKGLTTIEEVLRVVPESVSSQL